MNLLPSGNRVSQLLLPSLRPARFILATTAAVLLLHGMTGHSFATDIDTTPGATLNTDTPGGPYTPEDDTLHYIGNGTLNVLNDGSGLIELETDNSHNYVEFAMTGGNIAIGSSVTLRNGGYQAAFWDNNFSSMSFAATTSGLDLWDGNPVRVDALNSSANGNGRITIGNDFGTGWAGDRDLVIGVNGGSGTYRGWIEGFNGESFVGGAVTGSGGSLRLIKEGAGTQTIVQAAYATTRLNWGGGTIVNGGRLVLTNQSNDNNVYFSGTGNFTINNGATLEFNSTNSNFGGKKAHLTAGTISGSGNLLKTGVGSVLLDAGTNIALDGNSLIDVQGGFLRNEGGGASGWDNNFSDLNVASGATFDIWDRNARVDAVTGAGRLNKGWNGDNSLTIGVNNGSGTYTGDIVNNFTASGYGSGGGKFAIVKVGTGTQVFDGTGKTVDYQGGTTVNAGKLVLINAGTGSGNFTINTDLEFSATTSTVQISNGTVSGSGNLVKTGNGQMWLGAESRPETIALTGPNSVIDVQAGLLRNEYGNSAWGGNLARLNVAGGAFFDIWDGAATVDSLSGSGTINKGWDGDHTLTIGVNNGSGTFSGSIYNNRTDLGYGGSPGGNLSLIKNGTGTQTLSGSSTYAGSTTINGGALLVGGSITSSNFLVNSGGTLGGDGGFVGPAVINAGGKLAPGSSGIGTLNLASLALADGAGFQLEIGTLTSDVASVSGTVTLNGTMPLEISLLSQPVANVTYLFLTASLSLDGYASGARFSYLGNPLDEGEVFTVTGPITQSFSISYVAGGGKVVAVTSVPEPSSAAAVLGGLGVLLGMARKRRRA